MAKRREAREHEITLTGLAAGTTYYYRLLSTDLSGNTFRSGELQLTPQRFVYLPMTRR